MPYQLCATVDGVFRLARPFVIICLATGCLATSCFGQTTRPPETMSSQPKSRDQSIRDAGRGERPETLRVNSIQQTLVRVPAGVFQMGAIAPSVFLEQTKKYGGEPSEEFLDFVSMFPPLTEVEIDNPFWLGAYEVTIGEFRQFVEETEYRTDAQRDGQGGTGLLPDGTWGKHPKFTWENYGFSVSERTAVANVSWNDAMAFCRWLGRKEGQVYRLPTEPEWEYACRAGATTYFHLGNEPQDLAKHANLADQSLLKKVPDLPWALEHNDEHPYLAQVGKFTPNAFGVYDMHGNVLEWCASRYSALDPLKRRQGTGLSEVPSSLQQGYVLRGGNWFNEPWRSGCPSRSGAPASHRMSLIGFRVVMQ